ncbi:hypothetical protein [Sphingobacterium puteale]|uniref:hypothetical protein n=1 Tax=Sphingobacterium puteale TaxID=2420510 RepID=UPI003D986E1C
MELDTLYISIQIEKERLNAFFAARPMQAAIDKNWLQWWESRQMYNKSDLETIPTYSRQCIRDVLDDLLNTASYGAMEQYDDTDQRWTFAALHFSENYHEILPMLALFKQLGSYTQTGFALIFDWMWGGDTVMAYIDFKGGEASIEPVIASYEVELKRFEEADSYLQVLSETLYGNGQD